MTRTVAGLDRLLALLLGLVWVAVGVGAIIWQGGWYQQAPRTLSAPWLSSATTASWWPWATGVGGIILILLALRWLVAHLPHRRSPAVTLAGSDRTGQLTADLSALAAASATVLADTPGVRSTSGTAVTDRPTHPQPDRDAGTDRGPSHRRRPPRHPTGRRPARPPRRRSGSPARRPLRTQPTPRVLTHP